MKVKDVMTPRVIRVGPEGVVAVAARMLARYNVGALPVCDENGKIWDDHRPGTSCCDAWQQTGIRKRFR